MIPELLFAGYTYEKIAQKLNIPYDVVLRDIKKIRYGAKTWMNDLASDTFVHLYRELAEGLRQDMTYLNEMLHEESVKSDNHVRLRVITQLIQLHRNYGELLNKGPIVWSLENLIRKCCPVPMPTPRMPVLSEKP